MSASDSSPSSDRDPMRPTIKSLSINPAGLSIRDIPIIRFRISLYLFSSNRQNQFTTFYCNFRKLGTVSPNVRPGINTSYPPIETASDRIGVRSRPHRGQVSKINLTSKPSRPPDPALLDFSFRRVQPDKIRYHIQSTAAATWEDSIHEKRIINLYF